MTTKKEKVNIYFASGNYKVTDYKDPDFAKYKVTNTCRCFNNLETAILYCIGASKDKHNNSQLMTYVDTFETMINK